MEGRGRDPLFVSDGIREARARSSYMDMRRRPRASGMAMSEVFWDLLADKTTRSGAHTQDGAPGQPHNLIGMRQRRALIEGTMVIET
jgi:hypothetical protein